MTAQPDSLLPLLTPHISDHFGDVSADTWSGLLAQHPSKATHGSSQPFLSVDFLQGMEQSGAVSATAGWIPQHLSLIDTTIQAASTNTTAAMPLYAKTNSMGEFVFDWAWADAYHQHGLAYYPKLISAVPFSPIQGPRLLAETPAQQAMLLDAAIGHAQAGNFSSLHILFPDPTELPIYESRGLLLRQGVQFHWQNKGFRDFEDFLSALTRDKRKKVKQEQRRVKEAGITFRLLTGADISPHDWAFAYRCYANTYAVRGREPYLPPAFFMHLQATLSEQVLLVIAERAGEPIAMALNLFNTTTLWGRYWGCVEHVACLHFDTCYYQAIEFCIQRGIQLFEGGAQGEHKLARGFLPVKTWSAHWLAHEDFRDAVARFLARETQGVEAYLDELNEHAPFK